MLMKSYFIQLLQLLNENKIPYWADAGTLIGALRHEGIIPWDFDCDICIFIEDYQHFYDLVSKDKRYRFKSFRKDKIIANNLQPGDSKEERGFSLFIENIRFVDVEICYIDNKTIPLFWEKYLQQHTFDYGNGFVRYLERCVSLSNEGKFAVPVSFMQGFRFVKFYDTYIRIFDRAEEWLEIVYGSDVMIRRNSGKSSFDSDGERLTNFSPL